MTRQDADLVRGILQSVLEGFEDGDAIIRNVATRDIERAFSEVLSGEIDAE